MNRPPYRLLSLLLQYPDEATVDARDDIRAAIDSLPRSAERAHIESFWRWFGAASASELQQRYVETFDLQRRSSLYLTFFTEGDTRKRGHALLRLKRLYAAAGLERQGGELPDFLPLVLEFAELAPDGWGRRLLAENRAALELLHRHLADVASPYRDLVAAVTADLPRLGMEEVAVVARLLESGPPAERVGLEPFAPPEVVPR